MNEVIRAILSRRTIRAYDGARSVSKSDLETIVQCGLHAATASNLQPWHLTVVTDRALLDALTAANREVFAQSDDAKTRERAADPNYDIFYRAPAAIFVWGQDGAKYAEADCANATENMVLAAHALGLGACYIASHRHGFASPAGAALTARLGVPAGFHPEFALAVGYAAQSPDTPARRDCVNWIEG